MSIVRSDVGARAVDDSGSRWRPRGTSRGSPTVAVAVGAIAVVAGAVAGYSPLVALILMAATALVALTVQRPAIAGLLLVALVPALSGARESLGGMRPSEALVLLVGALLLGLPVRRARPRWGTVEWMVLAFIGGDILLTAGNAVRHGLDLGTNLVGIVGPLQFFLLYRAVATTAVTERHRALAMRLLLVASIPVAIVAILQQLDLFGARAFVAAFTGSDIFEAWGYRNYPRATGLFPSWHPLAGYLTVVLLLGVSVLATRSRGVLRPGMLGGVMALGGAALVLSQTFTALFAVGIGALVIVWRQRSAKVLAWLVAAGAIIIVLFGADLTRRVESQLSGSDGSDAPQTIEYRAEIWEEQYLPALERYWVLGFGPGFPDDIDWEFTESGYITLVLRGGVPLLVAGLGMLLAIAHRARRHDGPVAAAALAITLVLWPMNLVWPYLTNSGLTQPYWVLVGLLSSLSVTGTTLSGVHPEAEGRDLGEPAQPLPA